MRYQSRDLEENVWMREERLPKVCGYQNRDLNETDRGILAIIFYWIQQTNDCHLAYATFASQLHVTRQTIIKRMNRLVRLHYVRREKLKDPFAPKHSPRRNLTNQYRLGSRIYQGNDRLSLGSP